MMSMPRLIRSAAIGLVVVSLAACAAPASPVMRTISGRTSGIGPGIDTGSTPFGGLLLTADAGGDARMVNVAADGTYRISVPPGTYRISVLVRGNVAFNEFWFAGNTMSVNESEAAPVAAVDGDAVADVAFPALLPVHATLAPDPSGAVRTEDTIVVTTAQGQVTWVMFDAWPSTFSVPADAVYSICAFNSADFGRGGANRACAVVTVGGKGADVVIGQVVGGSSASS
jgi:hypothetical protein